MLFLLRKKHERFLNWLISGGRVAKESISIALNLLRCLVMKIVPSYFAPTSSSILA
ncbi:uncharacterized protein DS421_15g508090 [Arachis hypogaea]|nr:uncharacterized protein DS421_15g508090 [Arachis hypogaea]